MQLKMRSGKWRPFCLGLNVLISLTGKYSYNEVLQMTVTCDANTWYKWAKMEICLSYNVFLWVTYISSEIRLLARKSLSTIHVPRDTNKSKTSRQQRVRPRMVYFRNSQFRCRGIIDDTFNRWCFQNKHCSANFSAMNIAGLFNSYSKITDPLWSCTVFATHTS